MKKQKLLAISALILSTILSASTFFTIFYAFRINPILGFILLSLLISFTIILMTDAEFIETEF